MKGMLVVVPHFPGNGKLDVPGVVMERVSAPSSHHNFWRVRTSLGEVDIERRDFIALNQKVDPTCDLEQVFTQHFPGMKVQEILKSVGAIAHECFL